MGQGNAKSDLENYRRGHPDLPDNLSINENYLFYSGKIPSVPDGDYVDKIHANWWGDTEKLELHHGYIQWLFPIKESPGMNFQSKPLQSHEIKKIKEDPQCIKRFIKSYELMLHFYGCSLEDPVTGKLKRHTGWKAQYRNLNTHHHNFLRITRILKCLGELGFEHYKKPFLEHFINEIWITRELNNCDDSCENYWIGTIKDDKDRAELEEKVASLKKNIHTVPSVHHNSNIRLLRTNNTLLKSSFSSGAYCSESSSSSNDEDLKLDEEGKRELRQTILAHSEDGHNSHDEDEDAKSDDGNLDLISGSNEPSTTNGNQEKQSEKGSEGEGSQKTNVDENDQGKKKSGNDTENC